MPIYEYKCPQCSNRMELILSKPVKGYPMCPNCGVGMDRMPSTASIQFKGDGWTKKGPS